jgi:hypothetical protein
VDANFVPGLQIDQERQALFDDKSFFLEPIVVAEAAETNGIANYNPTDYEAQSMVLNLSVDDIDVTRQNPARPMEEGETKSKYVRHTVVHFQSKDGERMSDGHSTAQTLGLVPWLHGLQRRAVRLSPRFFHRWGQMYTQRD